MSSIMSDPRIAKLAQVLVHYSLELQPGEPGSGIIFENKIYGGVIPREYIPGVEKGVREASEAGVIAGYPVTDIKISLYDGSYHEVDSSEIPPFGCGDMIEHTAN